MNPKPLQSSSNLPLIKIVEEHLPSKIIKVGVVQKPSFTLSGRGIPNGIEIDVEIHGDVATVQVLNERDTKYD